MEGPSLLLLKEEVSHLSGRRIAEVSGTAKIDFSLLQGKLIRKIATHGKHFLIVVDDITVKIHFLMFGSYRINESRDRPEKLRLIVDRDVLNFYSCAVSIIHEDPDEVYDWATDVMSAQWDPRKARKKLRETPDKNVGDALLDQTVFAGVGNIIKTEVLYRSRIHPLNHIGCLPSRKLTELIDEARRFSFDFYEWKKEYQLRKNCAIYKKKKCKRCELPVRVDYTGKNPRRTFYCDNCQKYYC